MIAIPKTAALIAGLVTTLALPARAEPPAEAMNRFLDERIMAWAGDPVIVNAILAQNAANEGLDGASIEALDQAWRAEIGQGSQPTISPVIGNSTSDFLRARVADAGGAITEVLVMDSHGLNVAASVITSDYWQGDEAKFSDTYAVGPDARHFSEIEKDESTGTYQAQASFVIVDPDTGDPIGAMTIGINAEALL